MKNNAKVIAFGAVFIWGVWTLVPVILATLGAMVAIVLYGVQAFSLPAWALGVGAAALILTILLASMLREGPKVRLLRTIYLAAKLVGVLLVAAGAMMLIIYNLPELPAEVPSHVSKLDKSLTATAFSANEAFAWIALFVLPLALSILALRQVWLELHPN